MGLMRSVFMRPGSQRTVFLFSWSLFQMLILPALVLGQDEGPRAIQRMTGEVTLDGSVTEPAWDSIEPLPLIQYQPVFKGEMSENTEIRVAYDDKYFYASGRFEERHKGGIRANSLYRDRYSGDDGFSVILDTFNDNENALWFLTTPAGIRLDNSVTNDAEFTGGSAFGTVVNNSWNTYWDVETQVTDNGWSVEMRIPLSSLGFQSVDGVVTMGLITYRFVSHLNERHIYPAIPPDWGLGFAKPSQASKVTLENVENSLPVYVTPYLSGGMVENASLNNSGTGYRSRATNDQEIGLDVKYSLTNNLTLDATINTDFAQVEADDEQVNLTRFTLFFPEKRQFFQERAGIFNFATGRSDRLFHSRNIGLNSDGPVRILGGGRLVGRVGGWDVGMLDMQTEASGGTPAENFGVLRLRKQVFNRQSYAGMMLTTRLGDDGSYNVAYGLDGIIKISDREYLTTKWIQTTENDPLVSDRFNFFQSAFARVQIERRGDTGLGLSSAVSYSGRDYNPGIGFVRRRDFLSYFANVSYGWFPSDESAIRKVTPSLFISSFYRNVDGSLESLRASQSWNFDMKSGASFRPSLSIEVEDLLQELNFPENTTVPVGRYTFASAQISYNFPDGTLIRGRNNRLSVGSFYDGWRTQLNLGPTISLSNHVELSASYQYSRISFPDRNQLANIHLVGFRMQIGFNREISLNSFVQYNRAADLIISNIRFRYNFREGNDLWLVFNQNLNADRFRETPVLPTVDNRTVLLKYTYTFEK
jgi:Domain of unknown function (DUF5916)